MSNILEVQNVVKQYGDYTALNNVSLHVPKGSIYGLLGPNGAGKTSLIRIINQITMPDSDYFYGDGIQSRSLSAFRSPEYIAQIKKESKK